MVELDGLMLCEKHALEVKLEEQIELERTAIELHLARGRVDSLLRSVSVLDKWLEDNEGKIADEVRVRRVKHWREEALEQLRLNP